MLPRDNVFNVVSQEWFIGLARTAVLADFACSLTNESSYVLMDHAAGGAERRRRALAWRTEIRLAAET